MATRKLLSSNSLCANCRRGFLIAAGLEQAIDFLEYLRSQASLAPPSARRVHGWRRPVVESDRQDGEPLLVPVIQDGRRLRPSPALRTFAPSLRATSYACRSLTPDTHYPVTLANALVRLAAEVDDAKSQTAS